MAWGYVGNKRSYFSQLKAMLNKLKLSSILDEKVKKIIESWFSGYSISASDFDNLMAWSKNRGLGKDPPKTIYRGLRFKRGDVDLVDLLISREFRLKNSKYESWSTSPWIARNFSLLGSVGFVISSDFKGKDFIDLNEVEIAVGYDDYSNECEIITTPSCIKCSLDNDIECLVITTKHSLSDFLDVANDFIEGRKEFGKFPIYATFNDDVITMIRDFKTVIGGLMRKQDPDACESEFEE